MPPTVVELAHDGRGSGPLVVLVHGITEDRRSWDPLTNALSHDHHVLRVDLRGHGESPSGPSYGADDYAADIHAVIGDADEAPLVIGHSLGGLVATAYAAAHDTRGVINVDQPIRFADFRQAVLAAEPALRGAEFEATVQAIFASMRGTLPDDEWARLEAIRDPRRDTVLGTWALLFDFDDDAIDATVRQVAAAVQVPYLNLLGTDLGPGYAAYLGELLPQARLETWDGAGHYPHLVDPDRFLALVHDFEAAL